MSPPILVSLGLLALGAFAKYLYENIIRPRWHARHLPGPKYAGFMSGHTPHMNDIIPNPWHEEFGPILRFDSPFGGTQISVTDRTALHHVLVTESYKFPKPALLRFIFTSIVGDGIIATEGEAHRRQRKIMNHGFGLGNIKQMYPTFLEKADKLRDRLLSVAPAAGNTRVEMFDLAMRATLESVACAGFGYETCALDGDDDTLTQSFNELFGAQYRPRLLDFLAEMSATVKSLLTSMGDRQIINHERAKTTMQTVGRAIVEERQKLFADPSKQLDEKDLITALVKANMAKDLKISQKLSDSEVFNQIPTLLMAGVDTTTNAICWALYALSKESRIQDKLRYEFETVQSDTPSFDELNALPYLDAVVRETLRYHSPIGGTPRLATEDTFLPLSKPFVDTAGKKHDKLFIAKNAMVYIPTMVLNHDTSVWGLDAKEFKPERWLDGEKPLPEGAWEMPSVICPTFLAGPRSCIGFKVAIVEIKAILFSLIRATKFEFAVPVEDIRKHMGALVIRPVLRSQPEGGYQLPLLVSRV